MLQKMIAVKKATGECSVVATFVKLISVLVATIICYELQHLVHRKLI
jgi:hypothetical protein